MVFECLQLLSFVFGFRNCFARTCQVEAEMQAVAAYRVLDTFPAQRCEATFQVRLGS
jgi:hypothetical protein